jgi:hypothetical protein
MDAQPQSDTLLTICLHSGPERACYTLGTPWVEHRKREDTDGVLTRAGARVQAAATQELVKAEAIQTNEAILATMKDRLAKVEENLRTLASGF